MFDGNTLKEAKEKLVNNMNSYADQLTNPMKAGFVYENIDKLTVFGPDNFVL